MLNKKLRILFCVLLILLSVSGIAFAFSASVLESPSETMRTLPSDTTERIRITGPEIPPKTGDENHPIVYVVLSLVGISGLFILSKKQRA